MYEGAVDARAGIVEADEPASDILNIACEC